jgi:hypothetical protein
MIKFTTILFLLVIAVDCNQKPKTSAIPEEYRNTVFESIAKKLSLNKSITQDELMELAKKPEYREGLYALLAYYHHELLFPAKYYTIESAAESNLVRWLGYPTELDTIPSEIKLVSKETIIDHDTTFIYYVYKFRTDPPHWAAKDGWMFGAAGPYLQNAQPFSWPSGTFSRLNSVDSSTAKLEAEWNHKYIYRRIDE